MVTTSTAGAGAAESYANTLRVVQAAPKRTESPLNTEQINTEPLNTKSSRIGANTQPQALVREQPQVRSVGVKDVINLSPAALEHMRSTGNGNSTVAISIEAHAIRASDDGIRQDAMQPKMRPRVQDNNSVNSSSPLPNRALGNSADLSPSAFATAHETQSSSVTQSSSDEAANNFATGLQSREKPDVALTNVFTGGNTSHQISFLV